MGPISVQGCSMCWNQSTKSGNYPGASGHQDKAVFIQLGSREMSRDRKFELDFLSLEGKL